MSKKQRFVACSKDEFAILLTAIVEAEDALLHRAESNLVSRERCGKEYEKVYGEMIAKDMALRKSIHSLHGWWVSCKAVNLKVDREGYPIVGK